MELCFQMQSASKRNGLNTSQMIQIRLDFYGSDLAQACRWGCLGRGSHKGVSLILFVG